MAKYRKSFTNPHLYRQFSNNASEMFDYTMTNIMDGFYDEAMDSSVDDVFKAVCLSGIVSESNTGEGTGRNDAVISGPFINLIVRPLSDFGNIIPDPRSSKDPNKINALISLHASIFTARSDEGFDITRGIDFGQVLDCYFEKGSIVNSDFRSLRFSQPKGKVIETSFQDLSLIAGVEAVSVFDWSGASMLGSGTNYNELGAEHLGTTVPISSGIKWDEDSASIAAQKRKYAFEALRPYLPKGVRITSAFRTQADQDRINRDYAGKYGYKGNLSDRSAVNQFNKDNKLVINLYTGRGHGGKSKTGAFDLAPKKGDASVTVDLIWAAVQAGNAALAGKVKYSPLRRSGGNSSVVEHKNGCVHVAFFLEEVNLPPN